MKDEARDEPYVSLKTIYDRNQFVNCFNLWIKNNYVKNAIRE